MLSRAQAIELLQLGLEYRRLLGEQVHTADVPFGAIAKLRQVTALVEECEIAIFPERAAATLSDSEQDASAP